MSQNNLLASYFTNSADLCTNNTTDLAGRSFFDIIAECKDFNEKETSNFTDDSFFDIWPMPSQLINLDRNSFNIVNEKQFVFAIQDNLNDPIKQLVLKYFSNVESNKRLLPNADSVIADANGLQILIKCGCFRSVVNLTYKILKSLSANNQNKSIYTPFSLQIWFIRISTLMKLKLFKEAEVEIKQFENFEKPQFFYEFQSQTYPDRKGSMVPFGLRMLNAELSQYLGKPDESLASLCKLLVLVENVVKDLGNSNEAAIKVWHDRKFKVQFSIVNILINRKNYEKAIEILEDIASSAYSDKCALWSTIGKLYVQIGDVMEASNSFIKAQAFAKADCKADQCRLLINLSLIKIANGLYKEAYEVLKEANTLMPDNSLIINNSAFCLFYSGNLKEAIGLIEKYIHANPNNDINESLIFNLCTLYELESAKSQQKKLNLLLWLNTYAGDGFNESCIQLQ